MFVCWLYWRVSLPWLSVISQMCHRWSALKQSTWDLHCLPFFFNLHMLCMWFKSSPFSWTFPEIPSVWDVLLRTIRYFPSSNSYLHNHHIQNNIAPKRNLQDRFIEGPRNRVVRSLRFHGEHFGKHFQNFKDWLAWRFLAVHCEDFGWGVIHAPENDVCSGNRRVVK